MRRQNLLPLAAGYGALAGLRSFSAPTALSRAARLSRIDLDGTPLAFAGKATGAHVTALLALGELIADKTPWIPSRISPIPLIGRAFSGAIAGGSIAQARGKGWQGYALVGAAAALGAAFGAYELRRRAGKASGIPDVVFALIEDGIVVGSALCLISAVKD